MSQCDVMLKDIADSRRITTRIHEDTAKARDDEAAKNDSADDSSSPHAGFDLKVFILSRLFWPNFKGDDTLELPDKIQTVLDDYIKKYEVLKAARTLDFKTHLGFVDLNLEMADGTVREFKRLAPMVATIIMHFEDEKTWTLEDLSATMKIPSSVLEKKIGFWTRAGLVTQESAGVYVLDEEGRGNADGGPEAGNEDDDDESEDEDDELELYWSFVTGMLQGNPSLSVERIHSLLGMFVEGGYEQTLPELKKFLDEKVSAGELAFSAGEYQLASG